MIVLNAALTALNVGLWLVYGSWWSAAAAVFCGLMTLYIIAMEVTE